MKTLLAIVCLALASCSQTVPPEWEGTPNPLHFPSGSDGDWKPESEGVFGHEWMIR